MSAIRRVPPRTSVLFVLTVSILVAEPASSSESAGVSYTLSPASYAGFLTSKADPLTRPVLTGYVLSIPAAHVGQAAIPVHHGSGVVLTAGYVFWPVIGFFAAPLVRLQIICPDEARPGVVLLAAWVFGAAYTGEGGAGAKIEAAQLVVSSPVRRLRFHVGAALHTMPGSEFSPEEQDARPRPYDWDNPQVAATLLAEIQATRRMRVFMEGFWAGIGADEGFDSIAILLAGIEWSWTRTHLKLATGIFTDQAGAKGGERLPVPPIAALGYSF